MAKKILQTISNVYNYILLRIMSKRTMKLLRYSAVVGADPYGALRNLRAPWRPKDKSFDELKEVLIEHYSPTATGDESVDKVGKVSTPELSSFKVFHKE